MFITEKRRQVYDEKGALYKIDLLRSIRRKDAPQSMLRATEEDEQKLNQSFAQSKLKKVAQMVLIAIIIGACCMLVYNLTHRSAVSSYKTSTYQQLTANLHDRSLQEVLSILRMLKMEEDELLRRFVEQSRCRIESGGFLSCKMSLNTLGVKMEQ